MTIKGYISEIFASFQGEGINQGVIEYFIRFSGCNLRCQGCDTPYALENSSSFEFEGHKYNNPITAKQLRDIFDRLFVQYKEIYPINLTGGEPLLQAEFIKEFLDTLNYPGKIYLETNGTLPKNFLIIKDYIDFISMDWKLSSVYKIDRSIWEAHKEFLKLTKGIKIQVKIIVSKDMDIEEFEEALKNIHKIRKSISLIIQPYTDGNNNFIGNFELYKSLFIKAEKYFSRVYLKPQLHKCLGIK